MSGDVVEIAPSAVEINISDIMPENAEPATFHQSMLDAANAEAKRNWWKGVTICRVGWSGDTRILSLCCRRGAAMATLDDMKAVISRQKAEHCAEAGAS